VNSQNEPRSFTCALPQVANPQSIADLSLTAAIKMIEDLKAPEENPIPKVRSSKKTDRLTEAIKNSPLAILERAWEQAEQNERSIFLKRLEPNRSCKDVAVRGLKSWPRSSFSEPAFRASDAKPKIRKWEFDLPRPPNVIKAINNRA